ncbi:hypothetical protein V8C26DRAFT_435125 [Trichoderma gracile]
MADSSRAPELAATVPSNPPGAFESMLVQASGETEQKGNVVECIDAAADAMEDITPSDMPSTATETSAPQAVSQANRVALAEESIAVPQESASKPPDSTRELHNSICESEESLFVNDADAMDIELPTALPPPARTKRKRAPVAPMAPEAPGDETPQHLVAALHTMIRNADPDDFLAKQVDITALVLRLKHLQDQQPPKVSFTPAIAASRRTRLEAALELVLADICAIPPLRWEIYRKKLLRFSETEKVSRMTFAERLYKVTEIVYMPEELDALPKEEFGRLEGAVRICVTAAQALTVEGEEEKTDELGERWVRAKMKDLEFFKKMFISIRGTFKASMGEGADVEMSWEKKIEKDG